MCGLYIAGGCCFVEKIFGVKKSDTIYKERNGAYGIVFLSEPTETDHYLVWLTFEQTKEKLFLPHQIRAIEQIHNIYRL